MQKDLIDFFTWVFIFAITLTGLSTQATASQEEAAGYSISAPVVTTGTPAPGGHGPGMGRGYQSQTPSPGQGGPGYRGGYSGDPAAVAESPNAPINSPYHREAVPPSQLYGRPGYGRGGRGYGVGYPGYRGQGGSGYPQHRQYGNPPRYPAAVTPGVQAPPQQ